MPPTATQRLDLSSLRDPSCLLCALHTLLQPGPPATSSCARSTTFRSADSSRWRPAIRREDEERTVAVGEWELSQPLRAADHALDLLLHRHSRRIVELVAEPGEDDLHAG